MITMKISIVGIDPNRIVTKARVEVFKSLNMFGRRASGNGELGLARHLKRGKFTPNSPVWSVGGKNGKRVFYDTGAFRNMPSYIVVPGTGDTFGSVVVGILNKGAHPTARGSITTQQLAKILVSGASWTPTPAQTKMFWSRIDTRRLSTFKVASEGGSGTWSIPPRDFMKHLRSPAMYKMLHTHVDRAFNRVFKQARVRLV